MSDSEARQSLAAEQAIRDYYEGITRYANTTAYTFYREHPVEGREEALRISAIKSALLAIASEAGIEL